MTALFAFLHHLAAFALVGAIAVEFALARGSLDAASARKLLAADAVLGAAAGLLLVVGLLRVFLFEKGANYYFHNGFFILKLALFIGLGLLSIVPTREFLSWRAALKAGRAPAPEPQRMTPDPPGAALGAGWDRRHPALRRADGPRHRQLRLTRPSGRNLLRRCGHCGLSGRARRPEAADAPLDPGPLRPSRPAPLGGACAAGAGGAAASRA